MARTGLAVFNRARTRSSRSRVLIASLSEVFAAFTHIQRRERPRPREPTRCRTSSVPAGIDAPRQGYCRSEMPSPARSGKSGGDQLSRGLTVSDHLLTGVQVNGDT